MTYARRTSLPAVAIFLVALLTITTLLSLATGAFRISLSDLFGIIGDGPSRDTTDAVAHNVFWQVRLPRIVLAIIVGASLAVAGVIMQGIFRNPLAEPATVGVSAGAAVGAVIAIIVGLNQLPLGVQLAAFLGGTLSTALVYVLSRSDGKTEVVTLILTGIAINAFAGAVIGFAVFVADDDEIRSSSSSFSHGLRPIATISRTVKGNEMAICCGNTARIRASSRGGSEDNSR